MKKQLPHWVVMMHSGTMYGPFLNAAAAAAWACKTFDSSMRWSIVRIHSAF